MSMSNIGHISASPVVELRESLDVFSLPVHPAADVFPMIPPDELSELAEDIKENGLSEPLVIGKVNGELMLIDGRNRLAACKLAGVTPTYRIIDVENDADKLKSLIWSWNGTRRHMTSSQRAMAYAMMFPETKRGMGSIVFSQNCENGKFSASDKNSISRARFILKHDPEKAELVRDGHPDYPLSRTYEGVKAVIEERQRLAEEERQKLAQLTALRNEYPDLASMVDEGRLYLHEALSTAEGRTQAAREEAERLQREAEEKLAEEERKRLEQEHEADEKRRRYAGSLIDAFGRFVMISENLFSSEEQIKGLIDVMRDFRRTFENENRIPLSRAISALKLVGNNRLVKLLIGELEKL